MFPTRFVFTAGYYTCSARLFQAGDSTILLAQMVMASDMSVRSNKLEFRQTVNGWAEAQLDQAH
jgi:hypothetical protein